MTHKKTAVITGASSGIGKGIAELLSELDYRLILIARDKGRLDNVAKELQKKRPETEVHLISADVSDYQSLQKYLQPFLDTYFIDLLVNSAGYVKRGTTELSPDEFQKMLQTNLVGSFNLVHLITPGMKQKNTGRIINLSSICGVEAPAELGGYAASKFGLMGLNESLHKELAPYGIYVTAICPNLVATEMTKDVTSIKADEFISVDEIVNVVRMILSMSKNAMMKEIVVGNHSKFLQSMKN